MYSESESVYDIQPNDVFFNYDPIFDAPVIQEIDEAHNNQHGESVVLHDYANVLPIQPQSTVNQFDDGIFVEDQAVLFELSKLEEADDSDQQ